MENLTHSRLPNRLSMKECDGIGNVASGGSKTMHPDFFGVPNLSPRAEDYREIFGGFNSRAPSIPVLVLPELDGADLYFDVRSSGFRYSELFGDLDGFDFAPSYEDLFRPSVADSSSSEEARTPAEAESLPEESDHCIEDPCFSIEDPCQSFEGSTEFGLSYPISGQNMVEDLSNDMAEAQTCYFAADLTAPRPSLSPADHNKECNGGLMGVKQLRRAMSEPQRGHDIESNGSHCKGFVTLSDISLQTMPSHLPPPSRPPPLADAIGSTSHCKSMDSTGTRCDSSSFFDVEVDASSSTSMKEVRKAPEKMSRRSVEERRGRSSFSSVKSEDPRRRESEKKPKELYKSEVKGREVIDHENIANWVKEALQQDANDKRLKEATERDDKKKLNVDYQRAENEKILIEALQQVEYEKRLIGAVVQEEDEMKLKEDHEREGKERRRRKAREREDNEKRLKETSQREENDKKLWEAREEKERKQRMACKREEIDDRLKVAYEEEENVKRLIEAREKENNERRLEKERERYQNEKRLKETCKREERERRLKESCEREENERRLKELCEREENERRLKEFSEREENERKLKEFSKREGNDERLREAWKQEENQKKVKEDCEREENVRRKKEAPAIEENEKGWRGALEKEESAEKGKEAKERNDNEKKFSEACEKKDILKRAEEFWQKGNNSKRLGNGLEQEESERRLEAFVLKETEKAPKEATMWRETKSLHKDASERKDLKGLNKVYKQTELYEKLELPNSTDKGNASKDHGNVRGEPEYSDKKSKAVEMESPVVDERSNTSRKWRRESEQKVENLTVENDVELHLLECNLKKVGDDGISGGQKCTNRSRKKWVANGEKIEVVWPAVLEIRGNTIKPDKQEQHAKQRIISKDKNLSKSCVLEVKETERIERKWELDQQHLQKKEEEMEREREREKDRMAVDKANLEAREGAREKAEETAVKRVSAEAQQKALSEARERLEKACAEAREMSLPDKASMEAKLRMERTAVERATTEARERAVFEARERIERSVSDNFSSISRTGRMRQSSSSSDLQDLNSQSSGSFDGSRNLNSSVSGASYDAERSEVAEDESAQRCRARLERHQRMEERAAKALEEKNMRDLLAIREQEERNRLSETLDAEVKRWSSGKHGNLRALLSTLQYILGSSSGWQPIPLTEVITNAAVKKAYRKATLCIHPDKLQQRGASIQQKYICEKVFDLLKEAWNKFNSEER